MRPARVLLPQQLPPGVFVSPLPADLSHAAVSGLRQAFFNASETIAGLEGDVEAFPLGQGVHLVHRALGNRNIRQAVAAELGDFMNTPIASAAHPDYIQAWNTCSARRHSWLPLWTVSSWRQVLRDRQFVVFAWKKLISQDKCWFARIVFTSSTTNAFPSGLTKMTDAHSVMCVWQITVSLELLKWTGKKMSAAHCMTWLYQFRCVLTLANQGSTSCMGHSASLDHISWMPELCSSDLIACLAAAVWSKPAHSHFHQPSLRRHCMRWWDLTVTCSCLRQLPPLTKITAQKQNHSLLSPSV